MAYIPQRVAPTFLKRHRLRLPHFFVSPGVGDTRVGTTNLCRTWVSSCRVFLRARSTRACVSVEERPFMAATAGGWMPFRAGRG